MKNLQMKNLQMKNLQKPLSNKMFHVEQKRGNENENIINYI